MKNKINFLSSFIILLLFIVSIYSCSKSSGTTSTSTGGGAGGGLSINIDINGMSYTPSTATVKVGTLIKWINSDIYSIHTATSNDGSTFNSGNLSAGSYYSFTPTVAGTFPYHCLIHGVAMSGTLVVTN